MIAGGTPAREALEGALTAIAAAGCETPRLDAELLVAHTLGVTRERLLTDRELTVQGPAVRVLQQAVRRRAVQRESVAHIIGTRGFRRLDLAVDGRALVPRPETELLVEVGLELPPGAHVLDLATGSGAVALALKQERPDLHVTASDISGPALDLARHNGATLELDVRWLQADLLEGIGDDYDALLANLPYVADHERSSLPPEVLRHEPPLALFAGEEGLDVIHRLLTQLPSRARLARVALEVGQGQAPSVARLLADAGFADQRIERDLAGIERVVVGGEMTLAVDDPDRLGACLARGGIAIVPTDTVYGLACRPDDEAAIDRIYELKGRPPQRPSAVLFWSLEAALRELPELTEAELAAVRALLPGPATLLLANPRGRFPLACRPVPERLGLRVARLEGDLRALAGLGAPILQTSANLSGGPDPRSLREIPASIVDAVDLVLDAGPLAGTASSVIDLCERRRRRQWSLLREGALPAGRIEAALAPAGWTPAAPRP